MSALKALTKSIASDCIASATNLFAYLYWNSKGVRITPECRIHPKAQIASPCSFFGSTRIYARAEVDRFTYGTSCIIDNARVGKFCSLAPGVILGPNQHPLNCISTHPITYDAETYNSSLAPTVIGNDVWIGANAVVLCGVHVPDGCVIAASAVVTKDFEPFSIIGGVPAKLIGKRSVDLSFVRLVAETNDIEELKALARRAREKSCSVALGHILVGSNQM